MCLSAFSRLCVCVCVYAYSCTDLCECWQCDKLKLILRSAIVVSHTLKSSSCHPGSPLSQKPTCCCQTDAFLTTGHIVAADWRLPKRCQKINAFYCGCNPVLSNSNFSLPRSCHIISNPHQDLLSPQSSQLLQNIFLFAVFLNVNSIILPQNEIY